MNDILSGIKGMLYPMQNVLRTDKAFKIRCHFNQTLIVSAPTEDYLGKFEGKVLDTEVIKGRV